MNISKVLIWPGIDPEIRGATKSKFIKNRKSKSAFTSTSYSQNDLLDFASQCVD